MSCDCTLEAVLGSQTGVRGYLDFQDGMNQRLLEAFQPILRPAESPFDLVLVNIMEAAKFAVACELKVRENERSTRYTGRSRETEYFGTAVEFNSQCLRSAGRAREVLKRVAGSLPDLPQPDEGAFADARTAMFQALTKFNIMPPDFGEVIKIWDEAVAPARRGGAAAILGQLDGNLETLIRLRTQTDRGNAPHSPLPWWKYVVIALVIGAGIFAVIACFVWSACTWVWPAISAVAPWVFGMVDRGC